MSLTGEVIGEFSFDNRYFFNEGTLGQNRNHLSFTISPEIFEESSQRIFHVKPKFRKDSKDPERNLFDIQELYFLEILENKEIKYGISKNFSCKNI